MEAQSCNASYMIIKAVPDKCGFIRVKYHLIVIIQAVPEFGYSKVKSGLFMILKAVPDKRGIIRIKLHIFVIIQAVPELSSSKVEFATTPQFVPKFVPPSQSVPKFVHQSVSLSQFVLISQFVLQFVPQFGLIFVQTQYLVINVSEATRNSLPP